jgi:hypothetical protein
LDHEVGLFKGRSLLLGWVRERVFVASRDGLLERLLHLVKSGGLGAFKLVSGGAADLPERVGRGIIVGGLGSTGVRSTSHLAAHHRVGRFNRNWSFSSRHFLLFKFVRFGFRNV